MVDFNTRIFSEDDGKIIGAEITVISTSGDNLGSISVANAETLAEMQAQLALIDETYFTEERLEEILANISENTAINATRLNGFISSDFAKVSQLSNFAPVNHNHNLNQINGLYDYQIYASSYNVNIDSTVNIIVKVTNKATGNPVVGVTVPVLKNNESWQSGTTGVNGTFSLSYTADTWGLTTFSANAANIQVNVTGWRTFINHTNYLGKYNDEYVYLRVSIPETTVPTSYLEFNLDVLPDSNPDLRPAGAMALPSASNPRNFVRISPNSRRVSRATIAGQQLSNQALYATFLYKRGDR